MSDGATPKRRGRPPKARHVESEAERLAEEVGGASSVCSGDRRDEIRREFGDAVERELVRSVSCLASHERHGLIEEALYTHEMQLEHVRFDSKNRKWSFRPESRNSRASLLIHLKRGTDEREALIDNARFGADNVRDDVEAAIDLLDEALS